MTDADVRFHAYRLTPVDGAERVAARVRRILRDAIQDRTRRIVNADIRLEQDLTNAAQVAGGRETHLYMDFVRLRDTHGPGRASRRTAVAGFQMGPADFFGEETAALYVADKNLLIVQSNHFGPKAQGIADYLTEYAPGPGYELSPILRPASLTRFLAHTETRRVEVGIDLTKMSAADLADGASLGQVARIGSALGASRVHITFSVGHSRRGSLVRRVKDALQSALGWQENSVTSAIVSGRATPDGETEIVDLLEDRLVHVQTITAGPDKRLPFADRQRALAQALMSWRRLI